MMIDWSRWDALAEELSEPEGPYACFAAWEQIMDDYAHRGPGGSGWWDELDIHQRASLFGAMVELSAYERQRAKEAS